MAFKHLRFDKDEGRGIVKLTINRPDVRNALDVATRQELRRAVEEIERDNSIRLAIITGAGDRAFISGADVTVFKETTPLMMEEFSSTLGQQLYTDIENLNVPIIAMINGFCFGGGLEVAMCCDIRIASVRATFGQLEINVGLLPGGGGTQRLPRLVGWGRAKLLIYSGQVIDAIEAERYGLVDKVVPHDQLEKEVDQLAEAIVSKSPLILKLAKKAINRGMYTDLAGGLAYEKSSFALALSTEDSKEGVAAFLEKREPRFRGR